MGDRLSALLGVFDGFAAGASRLEPLVALLKLQPTSRELEKPSLYFVGHLTIAYEVFRKTFI